MQNSRGNAAWSPDPFLVADPLLIPVIVKQLFTVEKQEVKVLGLQQGLISQTLSHELF